ncbi:MAG: Trk system potassium transporter TrkA [Candidatus Dadabacteria bacterium]|nr:Trk system potassium transporter TrkA [Candidatus Dadabacteria bacterium]MYC39437.1 Trk system potassium transporter TrkA [Candidatus Dadabacteria bacterium]
MRRILIIGLGQVGNFLSKELSKSQEVVVIENDAELIAKAKETQDVLAIEGSGDDPAVLRQAEIEKADIVLAVTGDDRTNILASFIAHASGVKKIVAAVKNAKYAEYEGVIQNSNISVISSSSIISEKISALISAPFAGRVEFFASGQIELLKLRVDEGVPIINEKLRNFVSSPRNWTFVGLQREHRITIPRGDTELRPGDFVFALGVPSALEKLKKLFNLKIQKVHSVIIVGGGRVGCKVASTLHANGLSVRLIENDSEKARAAAEELVGAMVFEGDGTNLEILKEAGVEKSDYLLALTGDDENNVLSALLAKNLGIDRCTVLYSNPDYVEVLEAIGIDRAISVNMAVANGILNSLHLGGEANVSLLYEGAGEILEFDVTEHTKILGIPLSECKMPHDSVIGVCIRDGKPIFPGGDFVAQVGDRLVVFSLPTAVQKVEEILVS